ncbi:MAG: hypothetical protein HOB18_00570 [Nitrospina sp.]|nr:hypothetical protein [Nitrospina sp.]
MLKFRAYLSFLIFSFTVITLLFPKPILAASSEDKIPFLQKQRMEQEIQQTQQKAFPNQRNFAVQQNLPPQKFDSDIKKTIIDKSKILKKINPSPPPRKKRPVPQKKLPTVRFMETSGLMENETGLISIRAQMSFPSEDLISIDHLVSSTTAIEGYDYRVRGKMTFKSGSKVANLIIETLSPLTFLTAHHDIEVKLLPNPKVNLVEDTFKLTVTHNGLLQTFTFIAGIGSLLGVLIWSIYLLMRKKITPIPLDENTTADVVVTDEAVTNPKQDALGTRRLAKQLSLFLRNRNTKAPITLAITGQWGSGKSSVMGMLKQYLSDARYNPVWFNAWHHHSEEHLFGALLERIRQQAIPAFWTASGIIFRTRLLIKRIWDNPVLPVLFAIVVVIWSVSDLSLTKSEPQCKEFTNHLLAKDWQALLSQEFDLIGFTSASFLVIIGFLSSMAKGVTPFGLQPAKFIRGVSRSFEVIKVKTDPAAIQG